MTFISYAQNGEDVILWRALKDVGEGFYIDVGACDPDELSVTKAFYERGWHGLNIEPVREYHELCVARRPRDMNLNVAVTAKAGIVRFLVVNGTGLSTTVDAVAADAASKGWQVEARDVPALSLADICAALPSREMHFLKIDVEGGERAVLEGADFERFRPWIVVIEATVPLSTERNEHLWEELLLRARYERAFYDGVNLYYVAQEHRDLLGALAAPPNALDDYKPVRMVEAEKRIADLAADVAARQHALDEVQSALQEERRQREELQAQLAQQAEASLTMRNEVAELRSQLAQQAEDTLAARSELVEVQSRLSHQVSSVQGALEAAERHLAQSRRRGAELERDAAAQRSALEAIAGLLGPPEPGAGPERPADLAARVKAELGRHADAVELLRSRYQALASEHAVVCRHRDNLLSSTSWRVSAPLRKAKTAFQVVRHEPRLVVPLVVSNLRRRPGLQAALPSAAAQPGGSQPVPVSPTSVPPARPAQGAAPGTPEYEALDRRGQLAALIRHDLTQRRLAGP